MVNLYSNSLNTITTSRQQFHIGLCLLQDIYFYLLIYFNLRQLRSLIASPKNNTIIHPIRDSICSVRLVSFTLYNFFLLITCKSLIQNQSKILS
jgi:hypothetical protein